jgi:hypothetical protein
MFASFTATVKTSRTTSQIIDQAEGLAIFETVLTVAAEDGLHFLFRRSDSENDPVHHIQAGQTRRFSVIKTGCREFIETTWPVLQ